MQLVTATGTATHPRAFLTPPSSHQPTLSQASSAHLRLHHFLFSLQLSLSARPASAFFPSTSSSFPSSSSSSCSSKMSSDSHPSTSPPADYHVPPPKFDKDISNTLTSQEAHDLAGTCPEWSANIKCVLFDSAEIRSKVQELAVAISRHYAGRSVLCVGLLTGAFVFLADVVRHLTIPYQVDFMVVSSYGHGTTSAGSVRLKKDMSIDPSGRHVLIIEDLIDTGTTLAWLRTHLQTKRCASINMCCLLDKKARRTADVAVDFVGFECPDEFVVGYGMDFADNYRCLPYIGILKPEAYNK